MLPPLKVEWLQLDLSLGSLGLFPGVPSGVVHPNPLGSFKNTDSGLYIWGFWFTECGVQPGSLCC